MATVIEINNMRDGYTEVIETILSRGDDVAPRGQETVELLDAVIVLHDPLDALPLGIGRDLNLSIGAAEAVQLIGGVSSPALLAHVAPSLGQFAEQNGEFHGAYGRRIGIQLKQVAEKLEQDPSTRQAVITLWDPVLDNIEGKRDYPCTVMLQFLIRNDKLQLHTLMRSNDVWLGLAYDAFQFTQLQLTLARALAIECGPYQHHAISLHLYKRDLKAVDQLHEPTRMGLRVGGFGREGRSIAAAMNRAYAAATGMPVPDPTPSEVWYLEKLK